MRVRTNRLAPADMRRVDKDRDGDPTLEDIGSIPILSSSQNVLRFYLTLTQSRVYFR